MADEEIPEVQVTFFELDPYTSKGLKLLMNGVLGIDRWVLLSVGPACDHGNSAAALYAGGLTNDEVRTVLVDVTAGMHKEE